MNTNIDVEKTNEQIAFLGSVFEGFLNFFQNLVIYIKYFMKGFEQRANYEASAKAGEYDNLGE
ncbi:MAG: hypothetical protein IJT27_03400 [Clostridia bacterium]|nr:hypothetical protein [Clostridia bacterium]